MRSVFTKKLATIMFKVVHSDGSVTIDVDGESVLLKLGERFNLVSDMSIHAPARPMMYIRKAYIDAGYVEKSIN